MTTKELYAACTQNQKDLALLQGNLMTAKGDVVQAEEAVAAEEGEITASDQALHDDLAANGSAFLLNDDGTITLLSPITDAPGYSVVIVRPA